MNEELRKKLKAKLDKMNENNNDFKNSTWRLKQPGAGETEGPESTLRLLNYPFTDDEDPFPELYFHYNLGENLPGVLCPKHTANEECPVCDFLVELNAGGENDRKLAWKCRAQPRYYAVVVDRADEEPTPKFWGFSPTVYKHFVSQLIDPEYEHFMGEEKGIDVKVKSVRDSKGPYTNTSISFKRNDSALADSAKEIKRIVSAVRPLNEVFKLLSTAEIEKRLADAMGVDVEDNSAESSRGGNGTAKTTSTKSDDLEDIDAAFEEAVAAAE